MTTKLLPDILEIADRNNLEVDYKTVNRKEVRYKCPFCRHDSNKRNKFYLSVNPSRKIFKCWYCKESGGVVRFIALLENKSEQELIERVRKKNGSSYKKHPAEKLTRSQLKAIGYLEINWIKRRKDDYQRYKALRNLVWNDWLDYVKRQKRLCYRLLFIGLCSGSFHQVVEDIKKVETELGAKFLDELVTLVFQESKDDYMYRTEEIACHFAGRQHPFETYLEPIKNKEKEECINMLNSCVFVGRLGKEIDFKYTPNGKAVANFQLAVQRNFLNQQGEREADFLLCQAWGKVAENMANQLSKGDVIAIQARVQTRTYDDPQQQGRKVYVTEFIVEGSPTFIKVKKWENGNNNNSNRSQRQPQNQGATVGNNNNGGQSQPFQNQGQQQPNPNYDNPFGQPVNISDDDLPF